jgi:hypothetical protein
MTKLTYTLRSVAFPTLSSPDGYDDISISFDSEGGGSSSEFVIVFHDFTKMSGSNQLATKFGVFEDGMEAFLDPRVQRAVRKIVDYYDAEGKRNGMTPAQVVEVLESEGIGPSKYMRDARPKRAHPHPHPIGWACNYAFDGPCLHIEGAVVALDELADEVLDPEGLWGDSAAAKALARKMKSILTETGGH